ncbi:hypothetical protein [Micromonospora sp. NPDC005806]|uniref:hypothetical protein n=1 Tax=Micromonospora sp. NPDC005806 TaxID=3364234 RepID=UPI0036BB5254
MAERHPALARLDVLVGRWTVQPKVAGLGAGWTEFTWIEGGQYLRQFTDAEPVPDTAPQAWRENNPLPATQLIGLDDTAEAFSVLYGDARGVHRVYQMTFADGVWRMWRDAPGFQQRWVATVGDDAIDGRWEKSADGADWALDFELTYRR